MEYEELEANGSTSTALTTAFLSRTLRTLSTSQFLVMVTGEDEDDDEVCEVVVWRLNVS